MISSVSNEKIKYIQKLIKSSKKRYEENTYIVEGIRMFVEIPRDNIKEIYYTEEAYEKYFQEDDIIDKFTEEKKAFEVTKQVFKSISDTGTPQGILALVEMKKSDISVLARAEKEAPLILIIEKLQDPGNMGTIIRTAEGAGITGILVSHDSVDIYNPKVVRSTMGSIFRMNIHVSSKLIEDIISLKKAGVRIYGAHLDGEAFYDKDLTKPSAFLIGNEGNGLSDEVSMFADDLIRIPMKGQVESLNAATSAAVIAYEALRQRITKK